MGAIYKRVSEKTGKVSYRAQVRVKGYPSQSKTFSRLTDAKEWSKRTETAIKERRHFKTAEAEKHTLSELIERYLLRLKQHNPKRIKDVKQMLDWWNKEIGCYLLADINKSLIVERIEKLSRKTRTIKGVSHPISTGRVNRYIAALSHVYSIGMNEWEWIEQNPMQKISKLPEPGGRVRFLSDDERERLLKACESSSNPYLYIVVVLAMSTGMRRSELMNLRWQDVDLERGSIILHKTKNKERRRIYLAGLSAQLMAQHAKIKRIDSDFVFPAPNTPQKPYDIRRGWETAIKEARIENFRFHDLRHTAASYLAMNGASLAEISEVLGHKTLSMVKRYAHLSDSHTKSVVTSMNEKVFGDG